MTDQVNIKAQTANDAHLLFQDIADVIRQARQQVRQVVNTAMVQSYWQIGHLIVEQEQQGQQRASYGKQQLQQLSKQLTVEFGKGFDVRNLRNMRSFYVAYPNRNAVRTELSWTHYRTLLRVENPKARAWYQQEAIAQCWSARTLDRQISKLYYERILSNHDSTSIALEAKEKINAMEAEPQLRPKDVLRDPYVLDFLNLPDQHLHESDLEQGLLDNLQLFAAKYLPYLPTEAELKHELEQERMKVQSQLMGKTR